MSDLVFSIFAFHFLASIVWLAVCGFGAIQVVTRRVKHRFRSAFPDPIENAAS